MKKWKVKQKGGFFKTPTRRYNTKEEAIEGIKEHLPKGGIFSQSIHAELYAHKGLRSIHHGCFIRDTRYYEENGNDLAEPLDDVVLVCKHIKEHCNKGTNNQMFLIRAEWLHRRKCNRCEIKKQFMSG